jgi:hypothetical protein
MSDCYCQKPEFLKTVPEKCSREQIEKCHGSSGEHPCCEPKKDKEN